MSCVKQVTRSGDASVGAQEGFHLMVCDTAILFIFLLSTFCGPLLSSSLAVYFLIRNQLYDDNHLSRLLSGIL